MRYAVLILIVALSLVWVFGAAGQAGPEATPEATPEAGGDACPTIVQTALLVTEEGCDGTRLNQACYGYLVLDAEPRDGAIDFDFSEPGDVVDVATVESLRLSAMDVDTGQWGVVLLQLDAPADGETTADVGDGVTILLFGDAAIEDATNFVPITALENVRIRTLPDVNADILTLLEAGEGLTANGRTSDGRWLRVRLPDDLGGLGWLAADFVTSEGQLSDLNVVPEEVIRGDVEDLPARFGPMQAFYYQSGQDDAPCPEAPNSGMLIQTPEGVASVTIWMDEVVIQLDATAFIQAEPGGVMTVSVLEGSATVTANGGSTTVVAGTQTTVDLDENLGAAGVPTAPEGFDPDNVAALPVSLLDEPVGIPDPLAVTPGVPISGSWLFTWNVDSLSCPDGTVVPFESSGVPGHVQAQAETLLWGVTRFNQVSPGIYSATYSDANGNLHQDTLQVITPDFMQGEKVIDLASPICSLTAPFTLQLVGP